MQCAVDLLREVLWHLVSTSAKGEPRSLDFRRVKSAADVARILRRVQAIDPGKVGHLAALFEGVASAESKPWTLANKMNDPHVYTSCEAVRMKSAAGTVCTAPRQGQQMQICGGVSSSRCPQQRSTLIEFTCCTSSRSVTRSGTARKVSNAYLPHGDSPGQLVLATRALLTPVLLQPIRKRTGSDTSRTASSRPGRSASPRHAVFARWLASSLSTTYHDHMTIPFPPSARESLSLYAPLRSPQPTSQSRLSPA